MSRERELLQTALGILEDYEWGYGGDHHKSPEASILNDIRKLLAQPEQEQEPVAWYWEDSDLDDPEWIAMADTGDKPIEHRLRRNIQPLYLAPQVREPLSDKEITKNTPKLIHIGERLAFHAGVRFAERHHIIGGE